MREGSDGVEVGDSDMGRCSRGHEEKGSLPPHFFALIMRESCCFFAASGSAMVDEKGRQGHRMCIVCGGEETRLMRQ
jgi:hypothetical protein